MYHLDLNSVREIPMLIIMSFEKEKNLTFIENQKQPSSLVVDGGYAQKSRVLL